MDKQKQIEEISGILERNVMDISIRDCDDCAEVLYNAGYRKIPEGAVVLTREEYEELTLTKQSIFNMLEERDNKTRKETAEKFAEMARVKACPTYINIDDNPRKGSFLLLSDIDEICKEITERNNANG